MRDGRADKEREERYAEAARVFGGALERLAAGYERDSEARRDLLQDIHVALWRSLARYDGRCSLRTWVYRVAHNTAISRVIRPQAAAPTLVAMEGLDSVAEAGDRAGAGGRAGDGGREQTLDRRRALDRLYELIQRLRPLDRQVMLLYLEEEDAASIAEITGLSAAHVSTKVSRIKRILVRQFHQGGHHGE
jgi:RNA polymerase sigma-70 factor, ECF subfamily